MKFLINSLVLLGVSLSAIAQQQPQLYNLPTPFERYSHYHLTVRGGAAIPMGPFSDAYIDKSTIKNYSLALDWIFQKPVSIGVEVGKTFFSQKMPRALYNLGGQEVSAVQTRTLDMMPIQGVASYYFAGTNAPIRPYVQLAAGANLLDYTLYYGNLANQQQSVKLTYGAAAGAKFLFKKDGNFGADVRVKYNQTSLNYDYVDKGVSQLNATVGLFYRWW
ncbi:opacity family porin [Salmonirosea aquatica]|uniref:Porin opacity type domain-containing protein n=1 Tax=Salmonirosea aquatica TaxID=2654236 RepID=A0A7C9FRR2_9BACT|nr:hypothetical protein [Cytophagaceae bacterium SJW1-29]